VMFHSHGTGALTVSVISRRKLYILSLKSVWPWGLSSQAAVFTACGSNPTGLFEKNAWLSCDSVSSQRDTGEEFLTIVEVCNVEAHVVTMVQSAEMVVVVVAVAAVKTVKMVVGTAVAEARLVAVVVVGKDTSKSMPSLSDVSM